MRVQIDSDVTAPTIHVRAAIDTFAAELAVISGDMRAWDAAELPKQPSFQVIVTVTTP